jgi:hypothetical protein
MERTRRDKSEDKQRTSELIQRLAAQRERKGISSGHSTTAIEVAAASSIPLPSSFDEAELQLPAQADGAASGNSKPRSRLVRQDKAKQTSTAADPSADEVDGLADLLHRVGLFSSATRPSAQPQQQQQRQAQASSRHGSNNSSSQEDAIEDDNDFEVDSSNATVQRRRTAGTFSSRSATPAAPPSEGHSGSQQDLASVDSADSDDSTEGATSSTQRLDAGDSSAAAAAEPLVYDGGFRLDGAVARKLYPHQLHGVKWLWSLHRSVDSAAAPQQQQQQVSVLNPQHTSCNVMQQRQQQLVSALCPGQCACCMHISSSGRC